MEHYFEIGKITGTHGIRGTFRVFPTTQDPTRFEKLKEVVIELAGKEEVVHIQKVAYQKNMVLLTVKEITDINVAEKYKTARILIPEEKAIPLEEDEYYTRDLFGIDVFTEDGENLGKLVEVYVTGANDVYGVQLGDAKELLIPAIKDCILDIDIPNKKMTVHLLEGLR